MPYLIDGHNLIAALPDINIADPDDEAKLVNKLKGFVAKTGKKCTVVFDGGLPGGVSNLSTSGVKVVFAASLHTNADSLIMRRIRKTSDAPNWTAVSSDNEIRHCARAEGMRTLTSAEFARQMQRDSDPRETQGEKVNPSLSPEEVDQWMEAFGGDEDG